jgi:hypothetical protein
MLNLTHRKIELMRAALSDISSGSYSKESRITT